MAKAKKLMAKGTGKGAEKAERKPAGALALGNPPPTIPSKAEVKEVKPEPKVKKKMNYVRLHNVQSPDGRVSLRVTQLNANAPTLDIIRHHKNGKEASAWMAQSTELLEWLIATLPTCEKYMWSKAKKAEKPAVPAKAEKPAAKAKGKGKGKKAAPVEDKALDIDDLLG